MRLLADWNPYERPIPDPGLILPSMEIPEDWATFQKMALLHNTEGLFDTVWAMSGESIVENFKVRYRDRIEYYARTSRIELGWLYSFFWRSIVGGFRESMKRRTYEVIDQVRASMGTGDEWSEDMFWKKLAQAWHYEETKAIASLDSKIEAVYHFQVSYWEPHFRPYSVMLAVYYSIGAVWTLMIKPKWLAPLAQSFILGIRQTFGPGAAYVTGLLMEKAPDVLLPHRIPGTIGRTIRYGWQHRKEIADLLRRAHKVVADTYAAARGGGLAPLATPLAIGMGPVYVGIAGVSLLAGYYLGKAIFDYYLPLFGIELPPKPEYVDLSPEDIAGLQREANRVGAKINEIASRLQEVEAVIKGESKMPLRDPMEQLNELEREVQKLEFPRAKAYLISISGAILEKIEKLKKRKLGGAMPIDVDTMLDAWFDPGAILQIIGDDIKELLSSEKEEEIPVSKVQAAVEQAVKKNESEIKEYLTPIAKDIAKEIAGEPEEVKVPPEKPAKEIVEKMEQGVKDPGAYEAPIIELESRIAEIPGEESEMLSDLIFSAKEYLELESRIGETRGE